MDDTRRSILLGVKLRTLVSEHLAIDIDHDPEPVPSGSGMLVGDAAWMLFDGDSTRSLGMALAWAHRRDASSLSIVSDLGGGVIARRAAAFRLPVSVWFPHGRTLLPIQPEPLVPPPIVRPEHRALGEMMSTAGAVPNTEHGVFFGEVRGLEVCRVVEQPTTGFLAEPGYELPAPASRTDGLQLEVGVGAADREAFQMLHGDIPTPDALASVVAKVIDHRNVDSPQHPLNRLGRERFLRWQAEVDPALVGLRSLEAAEPPVPRANLKDPTPCVACGVGDAGAASVVFSSGVDLDLIPYVADVQLAGAERVIVALPERDLVAITRDLAALLHEPIVFAPLDVH